MGSARRQDADVEEGFWCCDTQSGVFRVSGVEQDELHGYLEFAGFAHQSSRPSTIHVVRPATMIQNQIG